MGTTTPMRANRRVYSLDLYRLQERLRGDVLGDGEARRLRPRGCLTRAVVIGLLLVGGLLLLWWGVTPGGG